LLTSLGGLQIGQTYSEAQAATGLSVVIDDQVAGPSCVYGTLVGSPEGVSFLGSDGLVARINVYPPSDIKTRSGIGIGSTESDVLRAYPGQIASEEHVYVQGGKYLEFIAQDPSLAGLPTRIRDRRAGDCHQHANRAPTRGPIRRGLPLSAPGRSRWSANPCSGAEAL
jgi:hypothetical protein